MDPVVYDVPVNMDDPPVDPVYQLTVPADAAAPSVAVPGPQTVLPGVVDVMVGIGLTVTERLPLAADQHAVVLSLACT